MEVRDNLRYAESHEWVKVDGDTVTVGISDFAQQEMTELVYVELPDVGRDIVAGDEIAVVESVKSASDIYSPCAGEVTEVNEALADNPSLVNSSPFDDGWLFKVKIADESALSADLKDAASYQKQISS